MKPYHFELCAYTVVSSDEDEQFDLEKIFAESSPSDYLKAQRIQKKLDDYWRSARPVDWDLFESLRPPSAETVFNPRTNKRKLFAASGSDTAAVKHKAVGPSVASSGSCPSQAALLSPS